MRFETLVRFLDRLLAAERVAATGDPAGAWQAPPGARPIRTVGLALEAWPGIGAWVAAETIDALVLHRPWRLDDFPVPPAVGVAAYHLAFDERLTLGCNPWLADTLGLAAPAVLGRKDGRPLGMIGGGADRPADAVVARLAAEFGGLDAVLPGPGRVERIAVVGAMTGPLVEDAARRGAALYVTGQVRQPALAAVGETGIGVVAVGHRRSETWGLRRLGRLIAAEYPAVRVAVAPADKPPAPVGR